MRDRTGSDASGSLEGSRLCEALRQPLFQALDGGLADRGT